MSTQPAGPAGPTAPSTSAPPSSSPAQPTPGADTAVATDAIPAAPLRRAIKPIPSLPGVISDAEFPSFGLPPDAGPSTGKARDASGRFLPGGSAPSAEDGAGDHTLEAGAGQRQDASPPTATKFKFGGVEFESQAAAEQNFRTLRGEYKPITQLAKSLGGIDKVAPTLQRASESARAWKTHAESLQAELEAYRQGGQPAGGDAQPQDEAAVETQEGANGGVDWDLYAEIRRLANESGKPEQADQWLISEVQKSERARMEKLLEDRLAPFDQERQRGEVVTQTEALFGQLAEYAYPDGSPAFPELHDETAAYEIGRLWASLGLPREAAMTPQGAAAAIALYRMQRAGRPLPVPAQPAVGHNAVDSRPVAPSSPSDAAAAAAVADGRTSQFELPGAGGPSAEAARILQGLRSVNAGNRSVLGFDA